jgi:hypothetical protein
MAIGRVFKIIGVVFYLLFAFGPPIYGGFIGAGIYSAILWAIGWTVLTVVTNGWRYPNAGMFKSALVGMGFSVLAFIPLNFVGYWLSQPHAPPSTILISVCLAYLYLGFTTVMEGLSADPVHTPMWAIRPTFGKMIMVGATWICHPMLRLRSARLSRGRAIAFSLAEVACQMAAATAFIWSCIWISNHFFENMILKIIADAILITVGGALIAPILAIVLVPLTLILLCPLDLLFPLKDDSTS